MTNEIKKLRRRIRRRWYLRFKNWNKKEAKRIARVQCYPCAEQLIDIYDCKTGDDIRNITIADIEEVIDEEISSWIN